MSDARRFDFAVFAQLSGKTEHRGYRGTSSSMLLAGYLVGQLRCWQRTYYGLSTAGCIPELDDRQFVQPIVQARKCFTSIPRLDVLCFCLRSGSGWGHIPDPLPGLIRADGWYIEKGRNGSYRHPRNRIHQNVILLISHFSRGEGLVACRWLHSCLSLGVRLQ